MIIIPKREIDISNLNERIDVIDTKKDKSNIIKILRIYSKEFKLNQFDTSIVLLRQFQQLLILSIHFIKQKGYSNDYLGFLQNLSENYLMLMSNFLDFTKRIDKNSIPIF